MIESLLSTSDNPYNPFDEWDAWFNWDVQNGYHTPRLLADIVVSSDDLSDADQSLAIDQAIDDIVKDIGGVYIKVTKEIPDESINV